MKANEGTGDRILRAFVGITLFTVALANLDGYVAWVVGAVGVIALVTGLAGWCPAYAVFGVSTCGRDGSSANPT